jgi:hypothetical protein
MPVPKPPNFFRSTGTVTSDSILDGEIVAADLNTTALHGLTAKTAPVTADAVPLVDSEASNVNKKVTLANLAALMNAVAQMVDDTKNSLFYEAVEVDFGVATAVDEKITDAAAAKGKLINVSAVVTEVFNGDADSTIVISKAATGATAMSSNIVIDKDATQNGNWLGSAFGAVPVSGANAIVASAGDVYAYSAANTNRSTGKVYFVLTFVKTA